MNSLFNFPVQSFLQRKGRLATVLIRGLKSLVIARIKALFVFRFEPFFLLSYYFIMFFSLFLRKENSIYVRLHVCNAKVFSYLYEICRSFHSVHGCQIERFTLSLDFFISLFSFLLVLEIFHFLFFPQSTILPLIDLFCKT